MNKNNHLLLKIFFLINIIFLGCEDKIQKWDLLIDITPVEVGIIGVLGDDTVSDTLSTSQKVESGTELNIKGLPNELGWRFDHWEGDLTGNNNPSVIEIDGDKVVTAVFVKLQYTVTVTTLGEGVVKEEVVLDKVTNHEHGTNIKLTATPAVGWRFERWEGDLANNNNPAIIAMDDHKSVKAVFTQIPYPINLTIVGNGEVIKTPNQDTYFYNSSVQLTANPDSGWVFEAWQGDITANTNTSTVTVQDTVNSGVKFIQTHSLSINTKGSGSVSPNPNNNIYKYNTQIQLTATPEIGWRFDHWEGDISSNDNSITIIMDANKTVTAVFVKIQYPLIINISGEGEVSEEIILGKTTDHDQGSNIRLTAKPTVGWEFDHWEGDLTGDDNPIAVTMDSNKTVTAVFIQIPFEINLTNVGHGAVTKTPDNATYTYNSIVQFTATPATGWEFDYWDGDLTGRDNPIAIKMDSNKTVVAVYEKLPYKTENVIIVVVDGARYSETWGDPNHQYIPRLADQMSNFGVINTQFYNNGPTWTNSGHTSITTGYYQEIKNSGHEIPKYPSIFQYWNKKYSNNNDMSWIITSKDKLEILGNSQHSNWKGKYQPSVNCGINGNGSGQRDDNVTFNKVIEVLSKDHPRLVLVNFREPDYSGHTGNWNNYIQGIKSTDEYVFRIWEYIQNESHYAGKTTMFVTNDHGRHLNDVAGGFATHGDSCEGCRHIILYSYGPDFKKGLITNVKRELIDISATIAELLKFNQKYGNGEIMYELFK